LIDTLLEAPPKNWQAYTPVLRAKASEWKALEMLRPNIRRRIVPIVEFVPDWKQPGSSTTTKRRAAQTPTEYVRRTVESALKATPPDTRAFVYFGLVGSTAQWRGIDLWSEFESRVPAQAGLIPLADLTSVDATPSLMKAVRSCSEVGLRIDTRDIGPGLGARIDRALEVIGKPRESAYIVVDLKDAPAAVPQALVRAAFGIAHKFAGVVVLAGVFPMDLTHYPMGVSAEPRTEWHIWWREHVATPTNERMLAYGDYTTQCAHYRPSPDVPGSVSLRYTTDDAILVFRGRQSNSGAGFGHEQMHGHCRLLVARGDYDGASFSWGDQRVHCWTMPSNGTGNALQWRTASIVHHITHVVIQLQDPVGSSATARSWARGQVPATCS